MRDERLFIIYSTLCYDKNKEKSMTSDIEYLNKNNAHSELVLGDTDDTTIYRDINWTWE